jgi:hypothetical protein
LKGLPVFTGVAGAWMVQSFSLSSVRFLFEKAGFEPIVVKRFLDNPLQDWLKLLFLPRKLKQIGLLNHSKWRGRTLGLGKQA